MKYLIASIFFVSPIWACPTGYIEAHPGVCSADLVPKGAATPDGAKPSNEKPPSDKMPSWQRDGIHVDDAKPGVEPSSATAHDYVSEKAEK